MSNFIKSTLASITALIPLQVGAQNQTHVIEPRDEQVVLLHGIARSSSHMKKLEEFLASKGYTVHNLDYPSTKHPLDKLAAMVAKDVREKVDPSKPVHFVGYSMGGIITRIVLNKYRPDNLGRVIQLASPNKGSEVADFLKTNWLYEEIYGPAGQQLTTLDAGIEDLMGQVNYEMGVLAGNSTIDPVSSAIIPGEDDGKVSVESTKVEGMRDHFVLPASHTFFPQNQLVHEQAYNFLQFGVFLRD